MRNEKRRATEMKISANVRLSPAVYGFFLFGPAVVLTGAFEYCDRFTNGSRS